MGDELGDKGAHHPVNKLPEERQEELPEGGQEGTMAGDKTGDTGRVLAQHPVPKLQEGRLAIFRDPASTICTVV